MMCAGTYTSSNRSGCTEASYSLVDTRDSSNATKAARLKYVESPFFPSKNLLWIAALADDTCSTTPGATDFLIRFHSLVGSDGITKATSANPLADRITLCTLNASGSSLESTTPLRLPGAMVAAGSVASASRA